MAGGKRDYSTIETDKIKLKDEPLLTAWEINASWRTVWLKAIARAWKDPGFRTALLDSSGPEEALKRAGFVVPDFFQKLLKVVVVEAKDKAVRHSSDQTTGGQFVNGWDDPQGSLRATLTLVLPPPPDKQEDYAIALADYDAGGRVYPFTLC